MFILYYIILYYIILYHGSGPGQTRPLHVRKRERASPATERIDTPHSMGLNGVGAKGPKPDVDGAYLITTCHITCHMPHVIFMRRVSHVLCLRRQCGELDHVMSNSTCHVNTVHARSIPYSLHPLPCLHYS